VLVRRAWSQWEWLVAELGVLLRGLLGKFPRRELRALGVMLAAFTVGATLSRALSHQPTWPWFVVLTLAVAGVGGVRAVGRWGTSQGPRR
jgi:hypothetical protein